MRVSEDGGMLIYDLETAIPGLLPFSKVKSCEKVDKGKEAMKRRQLRGAKDDLVRRLKEVGSRE